ncbi:MAG: protein kinase domain-containing protein [Bdellovibrionia bacterium]
MERLESPKSLKLSSHGGSLSAARPPELAQSSLIGEGQSALVEKISSESVRESSGLVEKANRLVDEKIENDRKKREESEWDKKKRSLILRKMDLFFRGLDSIYMNGRYDLEISLFGEKHREIIQRYKEHFEKAKNTAEFSELEKSDPSERLKKEFKNFLVSSTVKQQLKKKNEIKKQIEMSDNFLKSDFFSKASSQVLGFHRSDLVDAEKIVLDLKEKNQDLVLDEGEMKDLRGLIQLMDKVIPLKKELENRKRQIVLLSGQASIAQEHFRSISNNPSYKTEHDQLKKGFSDLSTAQNEVLQMLDQLKVQSRDLNVDPSTFDNKKLEVEKKLKQFLSQVESLAKQIEDLQLGRFEGGFKEFIFGKVAQTPYVFRGNSACKGVISDLAGLADAGKKLNRESSFSGFSDEVSRVQCSITNQGSEFEINFQLKSKVGNRSSVSDLSASVFCFNYEKYIIPKTIKTNGVTCDLAIAHATMKDVYHVFGLSDQSKVFLHKRNEGALALDHQNEVSGRSKRKMENEFTKNSWQLQAESSLEKRVFDQKLYGDLILKEPVYSEMINDKDQKSFQNGLQDFGGFSLQQRLDHLVSGNGTENKKLLNDMSRMKSCAQDLISQVEKMHDLGIFHRDIKPANILVDNRGRCRVIDFGSAVWVRPDENGKRYLVFNGYNHTQEYLRWFDSKNDALGGSPKLSSEDRDFKAYEEFERKVMEVTQGRGIEMKEGEAPIDAMVRFARENPRFELPSLEVDQIKKFTGGENDRAQLGAVLSMLLLDKTQLYGSPRQLVLNLLTGLRAGGASQSKKIEKKKELLSRFQQSQFGSASKDEGLKKLQSKAIDHLRYYYESLTDQPVPDTEDRQIKKSTSPEKVQQKARLIQKRQGLARNNLERMNQRQVKRAQVRPGLGGGR